MKILKAFPKIILCLALARLGINAVQVLSQSLSPPSPTPTPAQTTLPTDSEFPFFPVPTVAKRVQAVKDGLTLEITNAAGDRTTTQTVQLRCLAFFPTSVSQLEAKRTLMGRLETANGYLYLDDLAPSAAINPQRREVHLLTGTFLQTELAASGWVKFKAEPGCHGAKTIALASQQAQRQRVGGWE